MIIHCVPIKWCHTTGRRCNSHICHFCCINHSDADTNNHPCIVSEIKTFTVCTIKLKCSIWESYSQATACAQSDHSFYEHVHAVEHAIAEQLVRWFCGQSDAVLDNSLLTLVDAVDPRNKNNNNQRLSVLIPRFNAVLHDCFVDEVSGHSS